MQHFADHIVSFARVLRDAGMSIGTGQILAAMQAVDWVGVRRRDDFYQALFSTFVTRRDQVDLFDKAFHIFWKAPAELPDMMSLLLPQVNAPKKKQPNLSRIQQAMDRLRQKRGPSPVKRKSKKALEFDVVRTYSGAEVFQKKDFAEFTADEIEQAKFFLKSLEWPIPQRKIRRRSPNAKGRHLNMRQTMRMALQNQGEYLRIAYQGPRTEPRPVTILCDISGSMERYARMLLHFMHIVTGGMHRVESFVFGTRLTRVTRLLRQRDIDMALTHVSKKVNDWAGGTRIGEALKTFNYTWLRRVLRSEGVVLIISDGWDRGNLELLEKEMARLKRSCYRIIWLNPLLGYEGYEPKTGGMRTVLPYVDDFLPVHNLESLQQLGQLLSKLK